MYEHISTHIQKIFNFHVFALRKKIHNQYSDTMRTNQMCGTEKVRIQYILVQFANSLYDFSHIIVNYIASRLA